MPKSYNSNASALPTACRTKSSPNIDEAGEGEGEDEGEGEGEGNGEGDGEGDGSGRDDEPLPLALALWGDGEGDGNGDGDGEGNVLGAVSSPSVSPEARFPVARSSLVQTCR